MNEVNLQQEEFSARCQRILAVGRQLYQSNPDWVTFFREILGVGGAARSVFSNADFVAFEKTPEFTEIQQMVAMLRNRKAAAASVNEPTRVITVRLPESLHEALKAEANDHHTSMNRLCISKLLQVLAENPKMVGASRAAMPPAPSPTTMGVSGQTNFRSSYAPASSTGMSSPLNGR
jgi:predicted HicB family RNase H-like nuclease